MQVANLRSDNISFFVRFTRPHHSVTSKTLSRWVREVLGKAGVNTAIWDPHSIRSASSAHLRASSNVDAISLCKRADWSLTSGTYERFYKKFI